MYSLVLSVLALAALAAGSGYVPGKEYVYRYRGHVSAGFPEKKPQYSGIAYDTIVRVQPKGDYAVFSVEDKGYSTFNGISTRQEKHPFSNQDLPPRSEYNSQPFKVYFKDGQVTRFQLSKDESAYTANLRRGLISLFHLTFDPVEPRYPSVRRNEVYRQDYSEYYYRTMEDGLLGECETQYVIEQLPYYRYYGRDNVLNITKTKNYEKCNSIPNHYYSTFYGEEIGPSESDRAHTLHGKAFYHYDIRGDRRNYVIERVVAEGDLEYRPYPLEGQVAEVFVNRTLELIEERHISHEYELSHEMETHRSLQYDFDYKPRFTDQIDLKEPHYLYDIYGRSFPIEQIRQQIAELQHVYDDATYQREPQSKNYPAKFLELVKSISTLGYEDIGRLYREYAELREGRATQQELLARDVLLDVFVNAGTNPIISFVKALIQTGKLPDSYTLHFLQQLPYRVKEVTQALLDEIYDLSGHHYILQRPKLHAQSLLSLASIIYDKCVARYHPEGDFPRDHYSCPGEVPVRYFHELSRRYENTRDEYRRIAYITALGRLGVKESLGYFKRYLEDYTYQSLLARTDAVYSLRTIARQYPHLVRQLIIPLYYNTSENYEVRLAAFDVLLASDPQLYELETIARRLIEEKDDQVRSYVYSAFMSYENSTHPQDFKLARYVNYALGILRPYRQEFEKYSYGYGYSQQYRASGYNKDYDYGGYTRFSYLASDSGYIPRSLYLEVNDFIGGKSYETFSVAFKQHGLEKYADGYFGPDGSHNRRSLSDLFERRRSGDVNNVDKERREIYEKLHSETKQYEDVDGEIVVNYMGSPYSLLYFNESIIEDFIRYGSFNFRDYSSKYRQVPPYRYQRFLLPLDLVYLIPSEMGLPIIMDFKQPMYLYQSNNDLQFDLMSSKEGQNGEQRYEQGEQNYEHGEQNYEQGEQNYEQNEQQRGQDEHQYRHGERPYGGHYGQEYGRRYGQHYRRPNEQQQGQQNQQQQGQQDEQQQGKQDEQQQEQQDEQQQGQHDVQQEEQQYQQQGRQPFGRDEHQYGGRYDQRYGGRYGQRYGGRYGQQYGRQDEQKYGQQNQQQQGQQDEQQQGQQDEQQQGQQDEQQQGQQDEQQQGQQDEQQQGQHDVKQEEQQYQQQGRQPFGRNEHQYGGRYDQRYGGQYGKRYGQQYGRQDEQKYGQQNQQQQGQQDEQQQGQQDEKQKRQHDVQQDEQQYEQQGRQPYGRNEQHYGGRYGQRYGGQYGQQYGGRYGQQYGRQGEQQDEQKYGQQNEQDEQKYERQDGQQGEEEQQEQGEGRFGRHYGQRYGRQGRQQDEQEYKHQDEQQDQQQQGQQYGQGEQEGDYYRQGRHEDGRQYGQGGYQYRQGRGEQYGDQYRGREYGHGRGQYGHGRGHYGHGGRFYGRPTGMQVRYDGHWIVDKQLIASVGVLQPFDSITFGVGIQKRNIISLPLKFDFTADFVEGRFEAEFKPVAPHQIYHSEYEPYTYVDSYDNLLSTIDEPQYKPIRRPVFNHQSSDELEFTPLGLKLQIDSEYESEFADSSSLFRFFFRQSFRDQYYYLLTNPTLEPYEYDLSLQYAEGERINKVGAKFSYSVYQGKDEPPVPPTVYSQGEYEEYHESRKGKDLVTTVLRGEVVAHGGKEHRAQGEIIYTRDIFQIYHQLFAYYDQMPSYNEEDDHFKMCVSGYLKYPNIDYEKVSRLETLDVDLTVHTKWNAYFGKDCRSDQKLMIQGRIERTEEQLYLERHRQDEDEDNQLYNPYAYWYQRCVRDQEGGNLYPQSCIEYLFGQSLQLNQYTFDIKHEGLSPEFYNLTYKIGRYIRSELYDYSDENVLDVQNPNAEYRIEANVSAVYPVADFRIRRPHSEGVYTHVYVPQYNSLSAYYNLPTIQTFGSLSQDYCFTMGEYVYTFDRYEYELPQTDCEKILAHDYSPSESFIVFDKGIDHPKYKKAVKVIIGNQKVELLPTSDDSDIIVRVNGERISKIESEPYYHYVEGKEEPMFYVAYSEHYYVFYSYVYGLAVNYDGNYIGLQVSPYYKAKLAGLCGNYNGQQYDEYVDEKGYPLEDDYAYAYNYIIPSESCSRPEVQRYEHGHHSGHEGVDQGEHRGYDQGESRDYDQGERREYDQGERREYGQDERRSYDQGERGEYDQDERRSYDQGERRAYGQDERRGYGQEEQRGSGGYKYSEEKTKVLQITRGGVPQLCFSNEPVVKCRRGFVPQRQVPQRISYHCLPAGDESTKRLLSLSETRVLYELKRKSKDHEGEVLFQEGCHRV